mgnify:FL=1
MQQNEEKNCRVQEMFLQKTQPFEVTSEFVLPDYRSEISRLLWVRPVFSAPVRFQGGGKADLSGAVRYEVLYTGPDGKCYGVELEDGYAFSVPMELPAGFENTAGILISAEICPDTVVSRVTAPRKLSVRCRMHADVRAFGEKNLAPRVEGAEAENAENLCRAIDCGRYFGSGAETLELTGELIPDIAGDIRVISAHGEVFLPDAVAMGGAVRCRGEAEITVLCTDDSDGATPIALTLGMPIEAEIPFDGVLPDCHARATGTVTRLTTAVEDGRITVNAGVSLSSEAQGSEPAVVWRDLFVPGYQAEFRFAEETLFTAAGCANRNFSVNEEAAKKDLGMPEDAEILDAFCGAELRERNADGNKGTVLNGELCCHMLYAANGEYGVAELRAPLRTTWEERTDDMIYNVSVPKCRVRTESGRVLLHAEAAISARGTGEVHTQVLSGVQLTEKEAAEQRDPELFYPAPGETLFGVGKRYGISPARLAEQNGISADDPGSPESLSGVRFLLIG